MHTMNNAQQIIALVDENPTFSALEMLDKSAPKCKTSEDGSRLYTLNDGSLIQWWDDDLFFEVIPSPPDQPTGFYYAQDEYAPGRPREVMAYRHNPDTGRWMQLSRGSVHSAYRALTSPNYGRIGGLYERAKEGEILCFRLDGAEDPERDYFALAFTCERLMPDEFVQWYKAQ